MNEEQVKKLVEVLKKARAETRMYTYWHIDEEDSVEFREDKQYELGADDVLNRVWDHLNNWNGVFEDED